MELTSLDLHYVAQELSQLAGAKVEKVFQSDTNKRDVLFILYLRDSPKIYLRFLPGMLCIQQHKPDYPVSPPGFAMFLRKYLEGTRLQSVERFDRILKIIFASKTTTYTLVVEFIPPGNMLLLDQEGRIINLLENQHYKDRLLRGRQPYVAPPVTIDAQSMTDTDLVQAVVASTRKSIVTTLAIVCSLGGIYAEEACARANIQKSRNDLSLEEVQRVVEKVRELFTQPILAHADEERSYPFAFVARELKTCEDSSFLRSLTLFIPADAAVVKGKKEVAVAKNKVQTMIDAQRSQVAKFEQDIGDNQKKGERIFEEYQLLQEILHVVHEAREKKKDITEALKRFSCVKNYNKATGELDVEL